MDFAVFPNFIPHSAELRSMSYHTDEWHLDAVFEGLVYQVFKVQMRDGRSFFVNLHTDTGLAGIGGDGRMSLLSLGSVLAAGLHDRKITAQTLGKQAARWLATNALVEYEKGPLTIQFEPGMLIPPPAYEAEESFTYKAAVVRWSCGQQQMVPFDDLQVEFEHEGFASQMRVLNQSFPIESITMPYGGEFVDRDLQRAFAAIGWIAGSPFVFDADDGQVAARAGDKLRTWLNAHATVVTSAADITADTLCDCKYRIIA